MIRLGPCACPARRMVRVRRAAWMRAVFPNRALYRCCSCHQHFLATPGEEIALGKRAFAERMQGRNVVALRATKTAPAQERPREAPRVHAQL